MDVKAALHLKLQMARANVLAKVEGLDEHDLRRPLTPTGTNLLGLVKHLTGVEYGYFGESFGRPPPAPLPWVADGSLWEGGDMWARPDERSEDLIQLYQDACAHADRTIGELDLDAPALVEHWPDDRRHSDLGTLLVHMLSETAQHAGHMDIVRELIDGRGGADQGSFGDDFDWQAWHDRIQAAADAFKPA